MNIYFRRTLCSILFAFFSSTQVFGMLSQISKEKKILTTLKSTPSKNNEQIISIKEKKKNKTIFSLNPIKNKAKDFTLSLLKKKKYTQQDDEDESESTETNRTNRANKVKIIAGASLAVGFLVDNRKKFLPDLHATTLPAGWNDLTPIVREAAKPENRQFWGDLFKMAKPEIVLPILPIIANPTTGIWAVGTGIFSAIGWWITKEKSKKGALPYIPSENELNTYEAMLYAGNTTIFNTIKNGWAIYDAIIARQEKAYAKANPIQLIQSITGNTNSIPKIDLIKPEVNVEKTTNELFENNITPKEPTPEKDPKKESSIIDTAITYAVEGATIKALETVGWSIWNTSDRWVKREVNDLLGLKIPEKINDDEDSSTLMNIINTISETTSAVIDGGVDIGAIALDTTWSTFDCNIWNWRWNALEDCLEKYSNYKWHKIKTVYSKELAEIKDLDGKIKYISDHKKLHKSTKKTSLAVLKKLKNAEIQKRIDIRTANYINSLNIPQDEKDYLLEQLKNKNN